MRIETADAGDDGDADTDQGLLVRRLCGRAVLRRKPLPTDTGQDANIDGDTVKDGNADAAGKEIEARVRIGGCTRMRIQAGDADAADAFALATS